MKRARKKIYPRRSHERRARKNGYRVIAGVDEAGVGPLAGPVVAGAVITGSHKFRSKIADSKQLGVRAREKAFAEICRYCGYHFAVIGPEVIDRIGIFRASTLAMAKAVAGLPVTPDFVLVDGRTDLSFICEGYAIIKGDRCCLSIACASIIAKVIRDRIMAELHLLNPAYCFSRNKGYGTALHREVLKLQGPTVHHRMSYAPVRNAYEAAYEHKSPGDS